jgi:hypothetical protein
MVAKFVTDLRRRSSDLALTERSLSSSAKVQ